AGPIWGRATTSRSDVPRPVLRTPRRGGPGLDPGVARTPHRARAGAPRIEPPSFLPSRARLSGEERNLLRRLRPGVRTPLQGRRGGVRRRRDREGARVAPGSEGVSHPHARAAGAAPAPRLRRADAEVPGDARAADRASRRGRSLDRYGRALA